MLVLGVRRPQAAAVFRRAEKCTQAENRPKFAAGQKPPRSFHG